MTEPSTSTRRDRVPVRVGSGATSVGAVVFFVGTVLHPARHGEGIAEVVDLYVLTHSVQAIGLLLLCLGLANGLAVASDGLSQLLVPINAALLGTLTWFGLIVYDGAHNPATAQHAPDIVHTPGSLTLGAALIVVPALVLFPLGYAFLGWRLRRIGLRLVGLLIGMGAIIYTVGGALIFPLGPHSPLVQPVEVVGSLALAAGLVLASRSLWTTAGAAGDRRWNDTRATE